MCVKTAINMFLVTTLFVMRIRRPHRLQHHTLARGVRWDGKLGRWSRWRLLVSVHVVQYYLWARSWSSRSMDPMSCVPKVLFDHGRRLLGQLGSATFGSDSLRLGSTCGLDRAPCPVFQGTTIVRFACGLPAGAMVALLVPLRPPTPPRAMRSLASPNRTHF